MSKTLASLTPLHRLATARMAACEKMPYFSSGVLTLRPREVKGLGTLGVTGGNHLLVDYEKLGEWTAREAGAVVLHEYMHRFLRHAERWLSLLTAGTAVEADRDLWWQATDAEINDDLIDAKCDLPGNPVTPASLGFEAHATAESYFVRLKREQEKQKPPPQQQPQGEPDDDDSQDDSGGGDPDDDDSQDDSGGGDDSGESNGAGGEQSQDPQPEGSGVAGDQSRHPQEPDVAKDPGVPEPDQDIQRQIDAAAIQEAAQKSHGDVPAGLARAADDLRKPPQVPWPRKLSVLTRRAAARKTGSEDYAFDQVAREQAAMDAAFGPSKAPRLPGMDASIPAVAFGLDTSASMQRAELSTLLNEARHVLTNIGARITYLCCDAEVHTLTEVKTVDEMAAQMKGFGGTAYLPMFEAVAKFKKEKRPDVLILGTDGDPYAAAELEGTPIPSCAVIWLVTENRDFQPPFGEVIQVDVQA